MTVCGERYFYNDWVLVFGERSREDWLRGEPPTQSFLGDSYYLKTSAWEARAGGRGIKSESVEGDSCL